MTTLSPHDPILQDLCIEDLTQYLHKTGWKLLPHRNDRILLFEGHQDDAGDPIQLVLPRQNEFSDRLDRMAEAINLLSAIAGTPPYQVVRAVRALDRDILSVRLLGEASASGSVSLELAVSWIQGLRSLVSYAACAEVDPMPYFSRARSVGKQYVERCRFGHTFHGSFGLTIESPLAPSPGAPSRSRAAKQDTAPFERRVLARLMRGLGATQSAVQSGNMDGLLSNYHRGLNANMCEVLLEMSGETRGAEFEFGVSWSPEWSADEDVQSSRPVRLERKAYQYLDATARALRSMDLPRELELDGTIVQLRSKSAAIEDEPEDAQRTATIRWENEQGDELNVRVALTPEDYRAACDAHRDGAQVSVRGNLEKVGKLWTLIAPHHFQVLKSDHR